MKLASKTAGTIKYRNRLNCHFRFLLVVSNVAATTAATYAFKILIIIILIEFQ